MFALRSRQALRLNWAGRRACAAYGGVLKLHAAGHPVGILEAHWKTSCQQAVYRARVPDSYRRPHARGTNPAAGHAPDTAQSRPGVQLPPWFRNTLRPCRRTCNVWRLALAPDASYVMEQASVRGQRERPAGVSRQSLPGLNTLRGRPAVQLDRAILAFDAAVRSAGTLAILDCARTFHAVRGTEPY